MGSVLTSYALMHTIIIDVCSRKANEVTSPQCPHHTWVTLNLETRNNKPGVLRLLLSSSINFGIFCEITSLKLNASRYAVEVERAHSVEPASVDAHNPSRTRTRTNPHTRPLLSKNESSTENYLQCHFLHMIAQISPSPAPAESAPVHLCRAAELLRQ